MKEIGYQDERMADGTICRRFEDGRTEWRTRQPDERVTWRDAAGAEGTDELLGDQVIKRTHADGRAEYARDQGYGRTAWINDVLTVNRTLQAAHRPGTALEEFLNGPRDKDFVPPPATLTPAEEEELRRRKKKTGEDSDREVAARRSSDNDWGDDSDGSDGDDDFG